VQEKAIFEDQQRLRENMKALRGSAEEKTLLQRYTRQLDAQEDRLESLRRTITDLKHSREQSIAEMNRMIEQLSLDVGS